MNKIFLILLIFVNIIYAQHITVTGYGNSKDEALKSAFQNAVEQEVGVLVDKRTVMRNNKLIKNKILTYSNGFIMDYKEVSAKQQMGFWTVEINALVESQKLLSKIKKIKIKPKKITGTKKLYAQVVSQVKTKFDAEKLLKSFYNTFTSVPIESYYAKVNTFYIATDFASRKTVPVIIKWQLKYKQAPLVKHQLEEAHRFMKKLSVSKKEITTSVFSYFKDIGSNPFASETINVQKGSRQNNNLLLKAEYTFYNFPRGYSMIYPFNNQGFGDRKRKRVGYIVLTILDKNNKVIKKFSMKKNKFKLYSMVYGFRIEEGELYDANLKDEYQKRWDMPIKYLKRIKQVKAEIKWL